MREELSIRIVAKTGQDLQCMGAVLCKFLTRSGLHVFANYDYMSRVCGGDNSVQVRAAHQPVASLRERPDVVLVLEGAHVGRHAAVVSEGGVVAYDRTDYGAESVLSQGFHVPFQEIAHEAGDIHAAHAAACGIAAGIAGVSFAVVADALREVYSGSGSDAPLADVDAARLGYERGAETDSRLRLRLRPVASAEARLVLSGSEALSLGAIRAGCSFYAGYPMTPSTAIMVAMARHAERFDMVVEQAEDEIGAINMAIGASYAGVRTMTATSGGGLALMGEGVSLAAMTETPLVVVDAQRPAPATGMPTRTEQADLNMAIHLGHGEFARAVYTPGSIEEAYRTTIRAFNTAERYQIPVLILVDQHLVDSMRDVKASDLTGDVVRAIMPKDAGWHDYRRYAPAGDGIAPRAVPSWIDTPIYACGEEHDEAGHIAEDAATRMTMVDRRTSTKMQLLAADVEPPVACSAADARVLLVGFGSTYGVTNEICERSDGRVGFVHLPQVWPLPPDLEDLLRSARGRVVTIENNAEAQLAQLIRRETGITTYGSILRYDGRPFEVERVERQVREVEA